MLLPKSFSLTDLHCLDLVGGTWRSGNGLRRRRHAHWVSESTPPGLGWCVVTWCGVGGLYNNKNGRSPPTLACNDLHLGRAEASLQPPSRRGAPCAGLDLQLSHETMSKQPVFTWFPGGFFQLSWQFLISWRCRWRAAASSAMGNFA